MEQYQSRDYDVVDYQLFELNGIDYMLRGPRPESLGTNSYFSLIGAGQTFGVLAPKPYVHMVADALGLPALNLSVGGSSPSTFLQNPTYLDHVNNSKFCVIQVVSARGSGNSYFEARHGKNMLRPRGTSLPHLPGDSAFQLMMRNEPPAVVSAIAGEIRANWVKEMIVLLSNIRVPKILLWFSKRTPSYKGSMETYEKLAGIFPQFVNAGMIEEVKPFANSYVEVVTSRGMPNVLTNRFTGKPATVVLGDKKVPRGEDNYYPSPEMHEDAARILIPVLKEYTDVYV